MSYQSAYTGTQIDNAIGNINEIYDGTNLSLGQGRLEFSDSRIYFKGSNPSETNTLLTCSYSLPSGLSTTSGYNTQKQEMFQFTPGYNSYQGINTSSIYTGITRMKTSLGSLGSEYPYISIYPVEGQYCYSSLGTMTNGWNCICIDGYSVSYPSGILCSTYLAINVDNNVVTPDYMFQSDSFWNSSTRNLGTSSLKWGTIYSTSGTINTSDRSAKTDIHYLNEVQPKLKTMSNTESTIKTSFTSEDIINFVKKLNPATFVYKSNKDEYSDIASALNSNHTELVQLGLIADDIQNEELFNFIGATMTYTDEETEEEKTTLGLKPIPLAVLALTACKYLINEVEQLKAT